MSTPYRLSGNVEKTGCHLVSKAVSVAESCFLFVSFGSFCYRIHCKLCPGHGEAAAACCAGLLRGQKQRSMMQLFRGIQRFPFFLANETCKKRSSCPQLHFPLP